jgi:hypothetical protein
MVLLIITIPSIIHNNPQLTTRYANNSNYIIAKLPTIIPCKRISTPKICRNSVGTLYLSLFLPTTSILRIACVLFLILHSRDILILVSFDGFKYEYLSSKYKHPNFDILMSQSVTAPIKPVFPTKTFPNHYSLSTYCHQHVLSQHFHTTKHPSVSVFSLYHAMKRDIVAY